MAGRGRRGRVRASGCILGRHVQRLLEPLPWGAVGDAAHSEEQTQKRPEMPRERPTGPGGGWGGASTPSFQGPGPECLRSLGGTENVPSVAPEAGNRCSHSGSCSRDGWDQHPGVARRGALAGCTGSSSGGLRWAAGAQAGGPASPRRRRVNSRWLCFGIMEISAVC